MRVAFMPSPAIPAVAAAPSNHWTSGRRGQSMERTCTALELRHDACTLHPRHVGAGVQLQLLLGAVLLAGGQLVGSLGCVESVEPDASEGVSSLAGSLPPVVEFDPARRIVPLPNALLMDPATGRVNVPPSCGEQPGSAAESLRRALNQLDGFGTSRLSLVATLSAPVDLDSTEGHVFLVRLAENGVPLQSLEGPVALDLVAGSSERVAPDCGSSEMVPNLTLRPRAPLRGSSTYAVLLTRGIRSAGSQAASLQSALSAAFEPSSVR